jgi:hypothetical protein
VSGWMPFEIVGRIADMSASTYLDQLLDPLTEAFSPEVARRIVDLRASPEVEAHVAQLANKANAGTATPDEEAEYKDFVDAVDIIGILQAKARKALMPRPA